MITAKSIIEKADLSVSQLVNEGGYLLPEQSKKFYRMVIDQPTLLKEIRTVSMSRPKMKIDKVGFGQRILRKAPASGTALKEDERVRPQFGQIELDTDEFIAEVHIPYDVLEDNIEKENFTDTLLSLMAERVSLDLEELLILGDTTSNDPYLASKDGVLQLAANQIDGSGITAIDRTLFKTAIKAMPTRFLRNRPMMRFYLSHQNEVEYRDTLAQRNTELGDQMVKEVTEAYAFGVPVRPAAFMPNSHLLFTYPQNVILGIQRDIRIETDKDIRARVLIVVLTLRIDIKLEEPEAAVVVKDINV